MSLENFFFGGNHSLALYFAIVLGLIIFQAIRRFRTLRKLGSYELDTKFSVLKNGEQVKQVCLGSYEVGEADVFKKPLLGEKGNGEMLDFFITTQNRLWVKLRTEEAFPLEIHPEEVSGIELDSGTTVEAKGSFVLKGGHYLNFKMLPSTLKDLATWLKKQEGFRSKMHHFF